MRNRKQQPYKELGVKVLFMASYFSVEK